MKILILSDIHANPVALNAINETYDYLFCLGDLVDYGPLPKEVIAYIKNRAYKVVRGNHDNALAYNVDCFCSIAYKELSIVTRHYHQSILDAEEVAYLKTLPLTEDFELNGYKFFLCHAVPQDLFKYLRHDAPQNEWIREFEMVEGHFIFIGHTHIPMIKKIDNKVIINPGSVGQPKDGIPEASYAVWEDGRVEIKRVKYNINAATSLIDKMPIGKSIIDRLKEVLIYGK